MIKAVIIDDEDHVRENLKGIIHSNFDNVSIIGEGHSVSSAIQVINDKRPELVFLDIDLSDGSGFNVLEKLKNTKDLSIVFITAFNEYAIKAFRYNALDYLLKPINVKELKEAVNKISNKVKDTFVTHNELESMLENLRKKDEDKKVVVRNSGSTTYVKVKEIVRCEADSNYTTLFLNNGKTIVASKPLREYETLLPQTMFFRVHQSHLVNLHFVQQFSTTEGENVIMEDSSVIPIARRRKDEFFERLDKIIS